MAASSPRNVGLIVVGNSGVGKTWIVNIVIGEELFEHRYDCSAVTKETEFVEKQVTFKNGEKVAAVIFNIPGLIENDQEAIERNKTEIQKAFVLCPTSVIVFVTSTAGGRIRDEDVVAFKALNEAYQLKKESLCVVVNQLKKKRPPNYEGETTLCLENLFGIAPLRVAFINETEEDDAKGRSDAFSSLVRVIESCIPAPHEKHHDILLQVDEIKKARQEAKARQEEFDKMKVDMQGEIAAKQKEVEALKNAPPKIVEVHHHHHKSGGGGCAIM
eukprot:TRINITY_DN27385_c0_g1_i1.p1 TRINITY_DN27385_c0_g1~~TRINITY_DN27385_c0_g1_i1.p1  ORF type:complete len:298 (-),score=98.48 TRINITY_DN27385_c0_g1_i1:102-920(-)